MNKHQKRVNAMFDEIIAEKKKIIIERDFWRKEYLELEQKLLEAK